MGRLIDCNDVYNAIQITTDNFGVAKHVVETNMLTMLSKIETVEAIPKADYENRLKADTAAMLTELQLEIEEIRLDRPLMSRGYECYGHEDKTPTEIRQECSEIIQQKIDDLKDN